MRGVFFGILPGRLGFKGIESGFGDLPALVITAGEAEQGEFARVGNVDPADVYAGLLAFKIGEGVKQRGR